MRGKRIRRGIETTGGVVLALLATGQTLAEEPVEGDDGLDTISVTASRIERGTKEVAASLTVIDAEKIEQSKMFNIKEAIQGTPGVLIDSKNGGYDVRLIIRGAGQKANYGVREIQVLRDGVPMTDPDSFSRFDFIDTQDIERIEILRGPGSLYGAGAAGGTVQIISKSVFETAGENRVKIGFGNHGAENYHLRYGADLNDSNAMALTVSRRVLDNDWRRWNEFDTNQLSLKHGLMLEDGSTLESELSYSEANLQLPGSMSAAQFEQFISTGEQTDNQDAWKHSGRYSKIWFFNTRLESEMGALVFKPKLYFNRWSHYHPVTGAINDTPETNVLGGDLEFSYDHRLWGDSSLVAGLTARLDDTPNGMKYRYRDVRTTPGGRIIATLSDRRGALIEQQDSRITLYGLYLQETLRPAARWSVDLGLRVDHTEFDITTNEIERYDYGRGTYVPGAGLFDTNKNFDLFAPRISATFALTKVVNLYATLAQSDQVPSQSEIEKNAALNAATARNTEFGVKGRSHDWGFDLAVYYTRVEDEIVSVLIDGETTFQNAGETEKKGLETEGRLRVAGNWWLGGSYTYSDYTFGSFSEVINGRPVDRSGNRLPYIPEHKYSLFADWRHPSGFSARIQADSWGEYWMDNANTEKYAGYDFVTSLNLGYETGPHTLALNVDNLFDERYATEVKKDSRGKTYFAAAAPRNWLLSYRYNF